MLTVLANVSAIATALVAAGTAGWFWWQARGKRVSLENYLAAEKARGVDKGQRTILHLVANLGLTEDEILQAAFRSKAITRRVDSGVDGKATILLLEYTG